ncbi:MAG: anti-sigma factor [Bacillota bacterium]|nr:anti-sigma factor [Bacillota bacterium]
MEEELEKLELYQEFLEEQEEVGASRQRDLQEIKERVNKNQEKIIRKSKWRARFVNACITLALLCILPIIFQVVTFGYYRSGNPSKQVIYTNAIYAAVETTRPNSEVHSSTYKEGIFFSGEMGVKYLKKVGKESIDTGELRLKFLFNNPSVVLDNPANPSGVNNQFFVFGPVMYNDSTMWNTLEKLPEGTVTEVYITFNKLYETDAVFDLFRNKDLNLLWLAVDTGTAEKGPNGVLGFSNSDRLSPIRENWLQRKNVGPNYDGKIRNEHFIDTLKFLNEYKAITNAVAPGADIQGALDYVNKNGVKIMGVTVTGPTKEILKLREGDFVGRISVGESRLWNWD